MFTSQSANNGKPETSIKLVGGMFGEFDMFEVVLGFIFYKIKFDNQTRHYRGLKSKYPAMVTAVVKLPYTFSNETMNKLVKQSNIPAQHELTNQSKWYLDKYMNIMRMNSTDGYSISFLKINKNLYNQKSILIFETLEI